MRSNTLALATAVFIFALTGSVFAQSITIKASASPKAGGFISPSGRIEVSNGGDLQFTITPNSAYQIKDVLVDRVSQGPVNSYTFTNITEKHSIKAKFTKKILSVMITQGGNVSISPIGINTITHGKRMRLKVTPNNEDTLPILLVNGQPVNTVKKGNIYEYVLKVLGDTSIHATSAVEPTLTPNAKVADDATVQNLSSISEDKSVLTFNEITPYLESLKPGDVIIAGINEATPYGLLRKVTNITLDGSQVTVESTQATVEDVLEEGVITINKILTASDVTSFVSLKEGVSLQEPIPGPLGQSCVSLHQVLFDADDNPNTTFDQVIFNGNACISAGVNLALDIGCCPELKKFELSATFGESIDFSFDCRYDFSYSKEVPVAEFYFGVIPVGPLVFVPKLTIYVGITADVVAGITAGVSQSSSLTLGFGYDGNNWAPISNFESDFNVPQLPQFYASASAQAYVKPKFGLRLYDVGGGYVSAKGYLGLGMNPYSDPWLSIYAGIQAGVGVDAEIWGFNIIDKEFTLLDYRVPLFELSGNKPPIISSLTAQPRSVATGGTSTVSVVASDPDGDLFTCSWSTDGGTLSAITGCGSVTWTAPVTPGTYTIWVSVDDNKKEHGPNRKRIYIVVLPSVTLTVQKAGDGSGTVRDSERWPYLIDCGSDCSESFINISPFPRINLIAYPDVSCTLTNWSGCDITVQNECRVLMATDRTVTATFTRQYFTLSVQKFGSGSGTVTGQGIDCGSDCSESLSGEVTLTATPSTGSTFTNWTECYSTNGNICTVRLNENVSVYARFDRLYTLSVQKAGDGSGTVTGIIRSSTEEAINCGSDCSEILTDGTSVDLTATPGTGSTFTNWTGCDSTDGNTCTVWLNQNKTVTAIFTRQYTLSVQKAGTGSGVITGTGISCGHDCNEILASETTVTLTATPSTGSALTSWTGCNSTNGNFCTVTMSQNKTVTATFTLNQYTLSIQKTGTGNGTVTGTGISCGSDCSESLNYETTVTLTATPSTGSALTSWTGCNSTNGNFCTVTMSQNKTVTATFTLNVQQYMLSVLKTGTGTGTVTGGGINCGSDCSETLADGNTVTLTANPSIGSALTSWTGCNSTNGNFCTVTMSQNKTVTATFTLNQCTLSIQRGGCGNGTVTGTGISCGSDCSESFAYGTAVSAPTAAADSGSVFARFYRGTNHVSSTTWTINSNWTVTALFGLEAYNVCVQPVGNGDGLISAWSGNFYLNCDYYNGTASGTCADNLPTTGHYYATLYAQPYQGSRFDGWTGPCYSTGENDSGYWCQTIWVGQDGWDYEAFAATFTKN